VGSFQRTMTREAPISVEEAQRRVLAEIAPLPPEVVAIDEVHGRVLREDVIAPDDVPPADNSAMDGYAVRAADVPGTLRVIADIAADADPDVPVTAGTAARIMTGGRVPDGADAVVQVELTDAGSERVQILRSVSAGTNIRRRGEDMRRGEVVLHAGTVIAPGELGVLATVRKTSVRVGRRPSVAILATGDEIVSGRVANSNSLALTALTRDAGAIAHSLPPIPDDPQKTKCAIEQALEHDVVITTGGVSQGAFDFVKDALEDLGAETKFWQVAMKPGKPVIVSRLRDRVVFGLPGNPVSCIVGFLLFVGPALRKMMGWSSNLFLPEVNARAGGPVEIRGDRRTYLRMRLVAVDGELIAVPMKAQGSGMSTSMVSANALACVEPGTKRIETGSSLRVLVFGPILGGERGP